MNFLSRLFDSDFMPHGHCYFWQPSILWLHVISDSVIGLSYYSIPIALLYFIRRRADVPFNWIVVMFACFIFACGSTHFMNIWTVWHGTYRLDGIVKLITAVFSIWTAVVLWPLIPKALAVPSANQLKKEVTERMKTQESLEIVNSTLETRIAERTDDLQTSLKKLNQQNDELGRFFKVTVDREMEMVNLKREVDSLLRELNRAPKYEGRRTESAQPT